MIRIGMKEFFALGPQSQGAVRRFVEAHDVAFTAVYEVRIADGLLEVDRYLKNENGKHYAVRSDNGMPVAGTTKTKDDYDRGVTSVPASETVRRKLVVPLPGSVRRAIA